MAERFQLHHRSPKRQSPRGTRLFLACIWRVRGVDQPGRPFLLCNRGRFAYQLIPAQIEYHLDMPAFSSKTYPPRSCCLSYLSSRRTIVFLCRGGHIMACGYHQYTIDGSRLEHRC